MDGDLVEEHLGNVYVTYQGRIVGDVLGNRLFKNLDLLGKLANHGGEWHVIWPEGCGLTEG